MKKNEMNYLKKGSFEEENMERWSDSSIRDHKSDDGDETARIRVRVKSNKEGFHNSVLFC